MSIESIMAKQMSKSNGQARIVSGNIKRNIDPLMEWMKWLTYEPEHYTKKKLVLYSKTVRELLPKEIEELTIYKLRDKMKILFEKYIKKSCTEQEYMEVYNYMINNSINELMLDKLSAEELSYAKKEIERLSNLSKEDLCQRVTEQQHSDIYDELSMVDAYILHNLLDIYYYRCHDSFESEVQSQVGTNIARVESMQKKFGSL